MNLKKALFAATFASAFVGISIPAQAQYIVETPMPYGYEVRPARPDAGYVWQNGHWHWNGYRNVWVAGHWVRAYPDYYAQRPYRLYRYRDRDGDGVPDRFDRYPYDPYRS
ncbi:MAG TPA: YXWGXW repeat-containing protein [Burkholderiales bacterium]|jgi:hypothetical protein|nr:YXWGXW repeat-containing protein [Burkholderiales bacterium]